MKYSVLILVFFIIFQIKAQPPGCGATNDVTGATSTSGLYSEYFAGYHDENTSFFPLAIGTTTRIETSLNYTTNDWGIATPPAGGSASDQEYFSSRYRGSIYIATAGVYTFYLTSDDGSYLWLDNDAIAYPTVIANALINNGGGHASATVTNTVNLTAGYHYIQIQYGEGYGGNALILEYSATSPSISRQVVPGSVLCTRFQAPPLPTPPANCSCFAGVTSQLYSGYFADDHSFFTSNINAINRLDPNIGFNNSSGWGNIAPPFSGTNASPDLYSVRFSGQIYVPATATYTFYLTSDDASWMWIDADSRATTPTSVTALINNGGLHGASTVSGSIVLTAGLHDFKVHFGENGGDNICVLEYASTAASVARQTIPQTAFCSCMSNVNLPIELLDFTAENNDKSVLLKWQTATEKDNKLFEIERSRNSIDFNKIATVPTKAVNGNSLHKLLYQYTDLNSEAESDIFYYRLKQIDLDGTFKYHKIVSVQLDKKNETTFKVYPNPNNGNFVFSATEVPNSQNIKVSVYSIDGRILYNELINPEIINDDAFLINADLKLNPGVYFVVYAVNGINYPIKMIVN